MSQYNPVEHSIVQACFGTWCQYACDDFIDALLAAILREIERVHWNVYQHHWEPTWHGDEVEDPEIDGIVFTRYYCDACTCDGEEEHKPGCREARPNFQFEDVQIRWYKRPGRGMSTNKDWSSDEWRAWFMRCLTAVRAFEGDDLSESTFARHEALRKSLRERFPKAFHAR